MPGIFGLLDSQNPILSLDLVNDMLNNLQYDKSYKYYLFTSSHCLIGSVTPPYSDPAMQVYINDDKTLCLVLDGEIFNCDELRKDLKNKGIKEGGENHAELLFRLYKAYGVDLVYKVNGCFVVAIWDTKKKEAIFVNDRLDTHPLYYSIVNNRLIFAPQIKAILTNTSFKRTMDPASVADYFSFGFILGNKTFLKDINLMPPGSIMRYKNSKLSIEVYWDFPFQEDYRRRSTRDYVEELDGILDRTVNRLTRTGRSFGMGLSGGLDSRIVAGYVSKKVDPFFTFTFGDPDADDFRYAKKVSDVIGSRHQIIQYEPTDFSSVINTAVWLMEGLINTSEYFHLGKAMQEHVETAFNGCAGETLSGKYLTKALCNAKDMKTVKSLMLPWYKGRLGSNEPEILFSENYYKLVKGTALGDFDESFSGIQTMIPANIHLHHCMRNKVRKEWMYVNSGPSLYVRLRNPYFDYEVLDFFLKLPANMRLHQKVYKALLVKKFPRLGAIPRDAHGVSVRLEQHLNTLYTFRNNLGHFLLEKWYPLFRRFDPRGSVRQSNIEAYRGPMKDMVRSIVLESNHKRGYFNQNYLEKLLSAHFNGEKNNSFMIHKLVSFELFHRLFLDNNKLRPPDTMLLQ